MTVLVDLDALTIGERRKVNARKVAEIAESIEAGSLLHPITVYRPDDKKSRAGGKYHLAAGLHRVEALKSLGITTTQANVVPADRADIVEIDENLARADLSKMDRANAIRRKADIVEAQLKEMKEAKSAQILLTGQGAGGGPKGQRNKAHQEIANEIGAPEREVRQNDIRARNIADDVQERIAPLPAADSGVELDALASMDHNEQRQAVHRMERFGETAREAKAFIKDDEPDEATAQFEKIKTAWGRNPKGQQKFIDWLDDQ